jgi:hypothetical protein
MNVAILPQQEYEVQIDVQYLPSVSIILPFQPVMTPKIELEHKVKMVANRVEFEIMSSYPKQQALPIIIKLRNVIRNLNYNTLQKSIAIFVSPIVEKVFYLSFEVEEKVLVDEAFKLSDIGYYKKKTKQFLILLLSRKFSKIYVGNDCRLTLIKSNIPSNTLGIDITSQQPSFSKFVQDIDKGLSIILRTHPFPVFVMGDESILDTYRKSTSNEKDIIQFIPGDFDKATIEDLCDFIELYINDWEEVKQQSLLKKLHTERMEHKAVFGVKHVWKASKLNKSGLLLLERNFTYEGELNADFAIQYYADLILNNAFYIKDAVDEIVEKVLENGGDIEFVDDDALVGYGRIALLQKH